MDSVVYNYRKKVDEKTGCTCTYIKGQEWSSTLHSHDYYELFLVLNDGIVHYVNNTCQTLCYGTLVFIRPRDVHTFIFQKEIENDLINMAFTEETIKNLFVYLTSAFPSAEMIKSDVPPSVILDSTTTNQLKKKALAISNQNIPDEQAPIYTRMLLAEMLVNYFSKFKYSGNSSTLPIWLETLCKSIRQNNNFILGNKKCWKFRAKVWHTSAEV